MLAAARNDIDARVVPIIDMAIADGIRVLHRVRSHAVSLAVHPDRVGLMGFSAGATLTVGLGLSAPCAICADFLAPIYPHYRWVRDRPLADDRPPMFLAVAAEDEFGFAGHAIELNQAWVKAGDRQELHIYSKGGHGFGMTQQGLTSDHWIEHFYNWLRTESLL